MPAVRVRPWNKESLDYTFAAEYESTFIQIFVVGCEICMYFETACVVAVHNHPQAVDFGTIRSNRNCMQLPISRQLPVSEIGPLIQVFC